MKTSRSKLHVMAILLAAVLAVPIAAAPILRVPPVRPPVRIPAPTQPAPTKPPAEQPPAPKPAAPRVREKVDFSARIPLQAGFSVSMIAGTSDKQPTAVLLKWVVDNRWLPPQGFNLYRKGPGDSEFKKIAGPIKEKPDAGIIRIITPSGAARDRNLGDLQRQARAAVSIPPDKLRLFRPKPANVESAKPVFEEMKQLRTKEFTAFTGKTRQSFQLVDPTAFPKTSSYFQRFDLAPLKLQDRVGPVMRTDLGTVPGGGEQMAALPTGLVRTARPKAMPIEKAQDPVTQCLKARQRLLVGAMVNKEVNSALGLGYTDTNVTTGETYEYQLREISQSGSEIGAPVAKCTITVGADALPAKPTGLTAMQRDVRSVSLRWELDGTQTSARVISYDLFRTAGGQKKRVNGEPLMVGTVLDATGNYADPIFYFTDEGVPVGKVTYDLVGKDAFARQAEPATLDFTMADWETPNPPGGVKAVVSDSTVFVYWQPSMKAQKAANTPLTFVPAPVKDEQAMYNVWRYDVEGSKVWTKLNDQPLKPSFTPAPSNVRKIQQVKIKSVTSALNCTFMDKTPKKDNYYLYAVTALYQKNLIESPPTAPESVPAPDLAPPVPVADLSGKFASLVPQQGALELDPRWGQKAKIPSAALDKVHNLHKDPSEWKTSTAVTPPSASSAPTALSRVKDVRAVSIAGKAPLSSVIGSVKKATPQNSDLGGKIVLTWKAVTLKTPFRYKIYRANASAFVTPGAQASEEIERGAGDVKPKAGQAAASVKTVIDTSAVKIGSKTFQYMDKIAPSALFLKYEFIAETAKASFEDFLPKSRPMYYNYRVTVVNRWGVEGEIAQIQVRAASTVKPPTPEVVSAYPNSEGGVTLTWKPLEKREETAKYLVYRKPVDLLILTKFMPTMIAPLKSESGSKLPALALGAQPARAVPSVTPAVSAASKVSLVASEKASKLGMQKRISLAGVDLDRIKDIRDILKKPDYELVGEAPPDVIDAAGYVRYSDLKDLKPNQFYSYIVVAQDVDKWNSPATKPMVTSPWKVKVAPVTDLKASADSSTRGIQLTWKKPADEVIGYVVQKAVGDGTEFVQISSTIPDLKYTDFSVIQGRKYTYRVLAVDKIGNLSDPVLIAFTLPK